MNLFVNGILLMTLLAALLMPAGEAAVARGVFKNDKYPGKCYISESIILNPGEESNKSDMGCSRILCEENSNAQIQTCGVIAPPPGCKLGEPKNPDADYPDCCHRHFVCVK